MEYIFYQGVIYLVVSSKFSSSLVFSDYFIDYIGLMDEWKRVYFKINSSFFLQISYISLSRSIYGPIYVVVSRPEMASMAMEICYFT